MEEELGQLREDKARQDVQLVDLGEKLRHAERIVRESTENSENAAERVSAELDSTVQELQERESEVMWLRLATTKEEEEEKVEFYWNGQSLNKQASTYIDNDAIKTV